MFEIYLKLYLCIIFFFCSVLAFHVKQIVFIFFPFLLANGDSSFSLSIEGLWLSTFLTGLLYCVEKKVLFVVLTLIYADLKKYSNWSVVL